MTSKSESYIVELVKLYMDFYEVDHPTDVTLKKYVSKFYEGSSHGIQFIAFEEDIAIGFATLFFTHSTLTSGKITVMNDLYVKKEWRGKNVATKLFNKCTEYSKNNGFLKMEWVTAKDNYRGQGFYDKMGGIKSEWLIYSVPTLV